ncbi:hypothetical protein D7B24_000506 [Verticillium nonalfalfae]|uniref:Uncharacterized protein n=1 Tax=Verticillium nonalfalfae TaxID=1051616 RepID=A0A3M9Y4K7_9PEZI|nr:uncharacterized protein D7B24_000506 [Verticillium nonalfalfae]RNJ54388.1 hypothetical protein D7B24_000506 [Verticillium nonalfalfae]
MSSRILAASARAVPRAVPAVRTARTFQTSATLRDAVATPLPARKPVGAFRGGYVLSTSLVPHVPPRPPPFWHERKLTVVLSLARSLLGFFAGSSLAGAGVYSYLVKEYKLSNELLTEDIYALQAAVQRVTVYVQTLEEKMDALERKRK